MKRKTLRKRACGYRDYLWRERGLITSHDAELAAIAAYEAGYRAAERDRRRK